MTYRIKPFILLLSLFFLSTKTCRASDSASDSIRMFRVGEEIWQIQYGIVDKKLSYLVFVGPITLPCVNRVEISTSSGFDLATGKSTENCRSAIFEYPNGDRVELAGTGRILLISKNVVTETKARVKPAALEAYLVSKPKKLTLEKFIAFTKAWHENKTKKAAADR